jgi:histidine triad (HIT) family protein
VKGTSAITASSHTVTGERRSGRPARLFAPAMVTPAVTTTPDITTTCPFCRILDGQIPAYVVLDEPLVLAFLDQRPVFPGHVLLIPKQHYETIADLPAEMIYPFFAAGQRLAAAVQSATESDGTFMAINNVVSQSIPHLHMHVVPRKRKDGLRGFFWPRQRYPDEQTMETIAAAIRAAL